MNSQSRKKSIFAFPTAIPLRDKQKQIVAGYNHSYAYTQKKVYFWGEKHRNLHNQQQQSTHSAGSKESGEENDKMIVLELAVDRIATGKSHSFGWNDSNVYCWGSNEYYELGLQEEKEYSVTKMDILQKAIQRGYNLKEISCGEHHTLAYFHNKTKEYNDPPQKIKNALVYEEEQVDDENPNAEWQLFGWGQSNSYQLTINTLDIIPYPVISPCTFKSLSRIYSKSDYNIAICQGKVYSWGCNLFSRLGQLIYSSQLPKVRIPREVVLPEKIVKIGIGTYHVVAVSESGTAFSWGKGNQGQLGVDKLEIEGRPSKMICEYKIKDVSCGQSHTLVLVQNGRLMSCGSSNHGVLGHDSFDQNDKKKKVKKLEFVVKTEEIGQIVSISCGSNHNLVLTSKGEVFGWGSNEFFQIMPTLNENHGESRQKIKDVQKKDSYHSHAAKDSLQDRLSDWKRRYEAFKQAKLKQQQLFMAELSQIIGQGGRGRQTMN